MRGNPCYTYLGLFSFFNFLFGNPFKYSDWIISGNSENFKIFKLSLKNYLILFFPIPQSSTLQNQSIIISTFTLISMEGGKHLEYIKD